MGAPAPSSPSACSFPPYLAPAAAVATQPYLPYLPFTFAFCLPRLPFLDGSFFRRFNRRFNPHVYAHDCAERRYPPSHPYPLPASLLFDSSTTFLLNVVARQNAATLPSKPHPLRPPRHPVPRCLSTPREISATLRRSRRTSSRWPTSSCAG